MSDCCIFANMMSLLILVFKKNKNKMSCINIAMNKLSDYSKFINDVD